METNFNEMWCITCMKRHEPTAEHPACQCTNDPFPRSLHEIIKPDVHIDFRGWRFFAPFHCFYCGDPLCIFQFMFSRSCGGCDRSNSGTARLRAGERRIFAGRYEQLETEGKSDIECEFIDAETREDYPRLKPREHYRIPPDNRRRPGRAKGTVL